jgi:hypothetical protein
MSFVASARITSVADCEPVLPPLSMRTGMKKARATTAASDSSKAEITVEDRKPAISSISSQPSRLRISSPTVARL